MQILGDLRARLARTDHQHGAVGQRPRIAVVGRLHLQDAGRQALRHARHDRRAVAARCHHHLVGGKIAGTRADVEAAAVLLAARSDAQHLGMLAHRGIDHAHKAVEIGNDLVLLHKAMRIVAGIRMPRQRALPVRRDQAERVPALLAPGMRDRLRFEHEMVDARARQVVTHRQSGLTAADDDDAVVFDTVGRHGRSFFCNAVESSDEVVR